MKKRLNKINNRNDLEKELNKFYTIVEQTADAVFITDIKGNIEYINPAFAEITGFTKDEILGQTPRLIKSGVYNKKHYAELWSTILAGNTYRGIVINKKKNGELFYTDHTITPIKDQKDNILYFVGIWKDITERMLLERRKEEFISIASHELKTPITSIKAFEQVLLKKLKDTSDPAPALFLHKMDEQINKLTKLVESLLDVSKISKGKLDFSQELFNFDEMVTDTIETVRQTTNTHNILLEGITGKEIIADRDRIGQVIINLLNNAIKYSPGHDTITVMLSSDAKKVKVSIADHGIGISQNLLKKIFDRFYRVDDGDKHFPGLGIGLHITKEIITRHKGKIWAESQLGKGSVFHFVLPDGIKQTDSKLKKNSFLKKSQLLSAT